MVGSSQIGIGPIGHIGPIFLLPAVGFAPQNPPPVMRCSNTGKPVSALAPRYCSHSTNCPSLVVNPQSPCSDPFALLPPARAMKSTHSAAPTPETSSTDPHPAFAAHSQTAARWLHASPSLHASELRNYAPPAKH